MFSTNSGEREEIISSRLLGVRRGWKRLADIGLRLPQSRAIRDYPNHRESSSKALSFLHPRSIYPCFALSLRF